MIRFSLATLLLLVLFAGIGCAALVNANNLWRQTMVTATVTALVVATLAAVIWRGRSRVFALGFAIAGWIYLVLVFVSAFGLRDDLLTDKAVTWLHETIHGEDASQKLWVQSVDSVVKIWDASLSTGRAVPANVKSQDRLEDFADIGHSLWVMIVGCLGGIIAGLLASVKRQDGAERLTE